MPSITRPSRPAVTRARKLPGRVHEAGGRARVQPQPVPDRAARAASRPASAPGSRSPRRWRPCPARAPRARPRRGRPPAGPRLDQHGQVDAGHDLDVLATGTAGSGSSGCRRTCRSGRAPAPPPAAARPLLDRRVRRDRVVAPADGDRGIAGMSPTMVRAAFTSSSATRPCVTTTMPIMLTPASGPGGGRAPGSPSARTAAPMAFAIITERWRPPVQPTAIVR